MHFHSFNNHQEIWFFKAVAIFHYIDVGWQRVYFHEGNVKALLELECVGGGTGQPDAIGSCASQQQPFYVCGP